MENKFIKKKFKRGRIDNTKINLEGKIIYSAKYMTNDGSMILQLASLKLKELHENIVVEMRRIK